MSVHVHLSKPSLLATVWPEMFAQLNFDRFLLIHKNFYPQRFNSTIRLNDLHKNLFAPNL